MNLNHLEEAEETYFQHFLRAFMMSLNLLAMSFVSLIHSFLPFILTSYVSKKVREINKSID